MLEALLLSSRQELHEGRAFCSLQGVRNQYWVASLGLEGLGPPKFRDSQSHREDADFLVHSHLLEGL